MLDICLEFLIGLFSWFFSDGIRAIIVVALGGAGGYWLQNRLNRRLNGRNDQEIEKTHDRAGHIHPGGESDKIPGRDVELPVSLGAFLFFRSDPHPRRPVCPACLKDGKKSYLRYAADYDGLVALGGQPPEVRKLSCKTCGYMVDLPPGRTLEAIQAQAEAQLRR